MLRRTLPRGALDFRGRRIFCGRPVSTPDRVQGRLLDRVLDRFSDRLFPEDAPAIRSVLKFSMIRPAIVNSCATSALVRPLLARLLASAAQAISRASSAAPAGA